MKPFKSFETKRLILRPTSTEDASFVLALLNSPKWLQFIGDRNVNTLEEAEEYIKTRMRPQLERLGYSNYTVIRKTDQAKMGSCGLYDREGVEGIDIGFAFLPAYENQGYAFEGAQRIRTAAIDEFGVKMISAITTESNTASQKLIEKLGLKYIKNIQLPDDDELLRLYRLRTDAMDLEAPSTRQRTLLGFPVRGATKRRDLHDDLNAIPGILVARGRPHFEKSYAAYDFVIHPDGVLKEEVAEKVEALCALYNASYLLTAKEQ